jgi:hypothetical protein
LRDWLEVFLLLGLDYNKCVKKYINQYIGYLAYTNKKLLEIFDARLKKDKDLIFVIQSDEGPYPPCIQLKRECKESGWAIKPSHINTFFYSGDFSIAEEGLKTPINNCHYIFSIIFQQNLKKLPK